MESRPARAPRQTQAATLRSPQTDVIASPRPAAAGQSSSQSAGGPLVSISAPSQPPRTRVQVQQLHQFSNAPIPDKIKVELASRKPGIFKGGSRSLTPRGVEACGKTELLAWLSQYVGEEITSVEELKVRTYLEAIERYNANTDISAHLNDRTDMLVQEPS